MFLRCSAWMIQHLFSRSSPMWRQAILGWRLVRLNHTPPFQEKKAILLSFNVLWTWRHFLQGSCSSSAVEIYKENIAYFFAFKSILRILACSIFWLLFRSKNDISSSSMFGRLWWWSQQSLRWTSMKRRSGQLSFLFILERSRFGDYCGITKAQRISEYPFSAQPSKEHEKWSWWKIDIFSRQIGRFLQQSDHSWRRRSDLWRGYRGCEMRSPWERSGLGEDRPA